MSDQLINDFAQALRDYDRGDSHWSRLKRARYALKNAMAHPAEAAPEGGPSPAPVDVPEFLSKEWYEACIPEPTVAGLGGGFKYFKRADVEWAISAALAAYESRAPAVAPLTDEQNRAIAWARSEAEKEDYFGHKYQAKMLDTLAALAESGGKEQG